MDESFSNAEKKLKYFLSEIQQAKSNYSAEELEKFRQIASSLVEIVDSCKEQQKLKKDPTFHVRFDIAKPLPLHEELNFFYQNDNETESSDAYPEPAQKKQCSGTIFKNPSEKNVPEVVTQLRNLSEENLVQAVSNTSTEVKKKLSEPAKLRNCSFLKVQTNGFPAQKLLVKKQVFKENPILLKCSLCNSKKPNAKDPRLNNKNYKCTLQSRCTVCFMPLRSISSTSQNLKLNPLDRITSNSLFKKCNKETPDTINKSVLLPCNTLTDKASLELHGKKLKNKDLSDAKNGHIQEMACSKNYKACGSGGSRDKKESLSKVDRGVSGTSLTSLNRLQQWVSGKKVKEKRNTTLQLNSKSKRASQKLTTMLEPAQPSRSALSLKTNSENLNRPTCNQNMTAKSSCDCLGKKGTFRSAPPVFRQTHRNFYKASSSLHKQNHSSAISNLQAGDKTLKRSSSNLDHCFPKRTKTINALQNENQLAIEVDIRNKEKLQICAKAAKSVTNKMTLKYISPSNNCAYQSSDCNDQLKWNAYISDISDDDYCFEKEVNAASNHDKLENDFSKSELSIVETMPVSDNASTDPCAIMIPKIQENQKMKSCLEFIKTKTHQQASDKNVNEKLQEMSRTVEISFCKASAANDISHTKENLVSGLKESVILNTCVDWFEDNLPTLKVKSTKQKHLNNAYGSNELEYHHTNPSLSTSKLSEVTTLKVNACSNNENSCSTSNPRTDQTDYVNHASATSPKITSTSTGSNSDTSMTASCSKHSKNASVSPNLLYTRRNASLPVKDLTGESTSCLTVLDKRHLRLNLQAKNVSTCMHDTNDSSKDKNIKSLCIKDVSSHATASNLFGISQSDEINSKFSSKSQFNKLNKRSRLKKTVPTKVKRLKHSIQARDEIVEFDVGLCANECKKQYFTYKDTAYCWPFSYPSVEEIEAMSDCSLFDEEQNMQVTVSLEGLESSGYVPKCFLYDTVGHVCCSCCPDFCCTTSWVPLTSVVNPFAIC